MDLITYERDLRISVPNRIVPIVVVVNSLFVYKTPVLVINLCDGSHPGKNWTRPQPLAINHYRQRAVRALGRCMYARYVIECAR